MSKRIRLLAQHLKESVFAEVSRGLWTRHALVFQVLLAYRVWQARGLDPKGSLWHAFCGGAAGGISSLAHLEAFEPLRRAISAGRKGEEGEEQEEEEENEIWELIDTVLERGEAPTDIEIFAAVERTHELRDHEEVDEDEVERVEEVGADLCRLLVLLALRKDRAAAAAKR